MTNDRHIPFYPRRNEQRFSLLLLHRFFHADGVGHQFQVAQNLWLFSLDVAFNGRVGRLHGQTASISLHRGLQDAQGAHAIHFGGVFRVLERHCHMALFAQIEDFDRLGFLQIARQVAGVGQVALVQIGLTPFPRTV